MPEIKYQVGFLFIFMFGYLFYRVININGNEWLLNNNEININGIK